MGFIPYMMIFVMAVGNVCLTLFFNKKRQALDLTKPEDVKKDKALKLITMILPMETIFFAVIVIIFVKPLFETVQ